VGVSKTENTYINNMLDDGLAVKPSL